MSNVAMILPSKGRPAQLHKNVTNLLMQIPPDNVNLFVLLAVIFNDEPTVNVARDLAVAWQETSTDVGIVYREPGTNVVQALNQGYAALKGTADWYVLGSDDQQYRSGWLAAALQVAHDTGAQVVGLNDLHTNIAQYAPHYMMHADFIEGELGGVMVPPEYKTWWFDREICERAQRAGLYAPAWGAIAEHCHPDWQTAELDDTYRLAMPDREADRRLYEERRARNYA